MSAKSQKQLIQEERYEYCTVCSSRTGRAGRGEDSIYCDECEEARGLEVGPFCEECWENHKRNDGREE